MDTSAVMALSGMAKVLHEILPMISAISSELKKMASFKVAFIWFTLFVLFVVFVLVYVQPCFWHVSCKSRLVYRS